MSYRSRIKKRIRDRLLRLRTRLGYNQMLAFRTLGHALFVGANWCWQYSKREQKVKFNRTNATWRSLISQMRSKQALDTLLNCGLLGSDLARTRELPAGDRILVLAAHQDDETIGAGGTLLLCARSGKVIQPVYYTDGATAFKDLSPTETTQVRYAEARAVWRKIGGLEPIFMGFANRGDGIPSEAPAQLAQIIATFKPTTILLPNFVEQPTDHKRIGELLHAAHQVVPIKSSVAVWGYQITTRLSGNTAVDITPVWKKKYRVNQLWLSQNVQLDYAHMAMGRDMANTYFLKGTGYHRRAAHVELFINLPVLEYLRVSQMFFEMPDVPREGAEAQRTEREPAFFIVGMQKSGTYWLTAMLDAHPQIRCFPSRPGHADGTGEAHLFDGLASMDTDFAAFRRTLCKKLDSFFEDLVPKQPLETAEEREAFYARIKRRFNVFCQGEYLRTGKPLVGEKTTESVHHLDLVEKLYPGVKKVAILRDPRDRLVSFQFHQIRKGRRLENKPIDERDVAEYLVRVRKDYQGLLEIEQPYHILTYEQLQADTLGVVQAMLQFVGADADEATTRQIVEAGAFEQLAGRKPGNDDQHSHFRNGKSGDWSRWLSPEQALQVVSELDELTRAIEQRFGLDLSSYRTPHGNGELRRSA